MSAVSDRIGSYRLRRLIAEGGMGRVFEAHHEHIGARCAIKTLLPECARDRSLLERLLREAYVVNQIGDAGVVRIFDCLWSRDGELCLVMEYLEGVTLAERLKSGPLNDTKIFLLGRQIASILDVAHRRGIVHRDLKPANVMLVHDTEADENERPKILDFGVAKSRWPGMQTKRGAIFGTPAYMAPEQCRDASQASSKSDIYALGIMLYEMSAGSLPFGADMGALPRHLTEAPPALQDHALAPLVKRMLDKDPARRPTAAEVAHVLESMRAAMKGEMPRTHVHGAPPMQTFLAAPTGLPAPPPQEALAPVLSHPLVPARPRPRWGPALALLLVIAAFFAGRLMAGG